MKRLALIAVAFAASCSVQSQDAFDAKPFEVERVIDRNYQAVFADVQAGARKCWGTGPTLTAMPAGVELSAQLYPDLGYAEVYSYMSGTVFMPWALVRIERHGQSAKVLIKTGSQAGKESVFVAPALLWAAGDKSCR